MDAIEKTKWKGFLCGLILTPLVFWLVIDGIPKLIRMWNRDFEDQHAVTVEQLRRIGKGIAAYGKAHDGKRPEALAALAAGEFTPVGAFYDERRGDAPALKDGAFSEPPDVLYMPALRPEDPGDLLLAFSLVLREEGGKYPVLYNNGTTAELGRQDMLRALNRTYAYFGKVLGPQPAESDNAEPASKPGNHQMKLEAQLSEFLKQNKFNVTERYKMKDCPYEWVMYCNADARLIFEKEKGIERILISPIKCPEDSLEMPVGCYLESLVGEGLDIHEDDPKLLSLFIRNYPLVVKDLNSGDWDARKKDVDKRYKVWLEERKKKILDGTIKVD